MLDFLKHKSKRQYFMLLLSGFLLLTASSCQSPLAPDDSAQISLKIKLITSRNLSKTSALASITRVVVTVSAGVFETASYKELVVQELTVSDRSAQGTISVPMGEDRTFSVKAFDANGFIQYSGITNMDITENTFTVQIGLKPIPPNRPTLSYDNKTGRFAWTKSTALDFAAYELYRANAPGGTRLSKLIYTTSAVDSTFYQDTESLPEGDYYYRLFVVDTESLVSGGSNEVKVIIIN